MSAVTIATRGYVVAVAQTVVQDVDGTPIPSDNATLLVSPTSSDGSVLVQDSQTATVSTDDGGATAIAADSDTVIIKPGC